MKDFSLDNIIAVVIAVVGILKAIQEILKSPVISDLRSAIKSGGITRAKELLKDKAFALAARYQQVFVDGLKEDAKDGKIDRDELKKRLSEIKALALKDFKTEAGGGALLQALQTLGVVDIDAELDQLLELAIVQLKRPGFSIPLPTAGGS